MSIVYSRRARTSPSHFAAVNPETRETRTRTSIRIQATVSIIARRILYHNPGPLPKN
jgi:hypothetical protein